MSITRLRRGEWLSGFGAIAMLVVLSLEWFGLERGGVFVRPQVIGGTATAHAETGWSGLGWFVLALVCVQIVIALAIVLTAASRQPPAWAVASAVIGSAFGLVAAIALAIRLLSQPGLGLDVEDRFVEVLLAAYLGLAASLLMWAGAWKAMADERRDAPESAYTPPPPRPVPPPQGAPPAGAA